MLPRQMPISSRSHTYFALFSNHWIPVCRSRGYTNSSIGFTKAIAHCLLKSSIQLSRNIPFCATKSAVYCLLFSTEPRFVVCLSLEWLLQQMKRNVKYIIDCSSYSRPYILFSMLVKAQVDLRHSFAQVKRLKRTKNMLVLCERKRKEKNTIKTRQKRLCI